jgi:hypothetical protein
VEASFFVPEIKGILGKEIPRIILGILKAPCSHSNGDFHHAQENTLITFKWYLEDKSSPL